MSKKSVLKVGNENRQKVETYRQSLFTEADNLFSYFIPKKILQLDLFLKEDVVNVSDLSLIHAPLEIPIPDPPKQEDEMETDKEDEKKKEAPKCGFIKGNEKMLALLDRVKPEIKTLRETCILVATWIQHMIPKIEDGNDFGVAIQEKILERITAVKTKVEGFQTYISKYYSERGDAVAKASKDTHVMDYRSLVHEKDEAVYSEIRVILMDIRGFYAELYDIISKNEDKVTNPKGEREAIDVLREREGDGQCCSCFFFSLCYHFTSFNRKLMVFKTHHKVTAHTHLAFLLVFRFEISRCVEDCSLPSFKVSCLKISKIKVTKKICMSLNLFYLYIIFLYKWGHTF